MKCDFAFFVVLFVFFRFFSFSFVFNKTFSLERQLTFPTSISAQEVQWEFMHGLMENAIYGGRVDNIFDMRALFLLVDLNLTGDMRVL